MINDPLWGEIKCVDAEKLQELLKEIKPMDLVPVIRCKDCIKREICRTSTTWAVAPKDDWYCADAERRTDG